MNKVTVTVLLGQDKVDTDLMLTLDEVQELRLKALGNGSDPSTCLTDIVSFFIAYCEVDPEGTEWPKPTPDPLCRVYMKRFARKTGCTLQEVVDVALTCHKYRLFPSIDYLDPRKYAILLEECAAEPEIGRHSNVTFGSRKPIVTPVVRNAKGDK